MTYRNSVSVVLGVFSGRHFPIARTNVRADDDDDDSFDDDALVRPYVMNE
jgi:hypothetical protein